MKKNPIPDLNIAHLPEAESTLTELFEFALSFNGYVFAGEDNCHVLAAKVHDAWIGNTGALTSFSIDELRTALFFEQRVDHWQSPCGTGDYRFMRAIVEELRNRLSAK